MPRKSRARSRSIWLWQLSLAAGVVMITAIGSVLIPDMLIAPLFVTGALGVIAITLTTLAAPWHRLPSSAVRFVPLADIVAIGLMGYGGIYRLNYLWVFPIAWLATYYSFRWLVTGLSTVTVVLATDIVLNHAAPMATQRLVVIVLSLTFLGVVMFNVADHARALRRLLRRHSSRLQAALARSEAAAQRTRQMVDSLDVAMARISDRGEILAANDAFVELFALDPDDLSLPGRSVEYDSEWGDALPAAERPLARAARGELTTDERAWLYDPDGGWHVVSISTRPLPPASDGNSTALIVQDVSELHRVEQDRLAIIAAVSHELRNPLTAVLGRTEMLLEKDDLSPRARDQIAIIDAAGERMLRLVSENLAQADGLSTAPTAKAPVDVQRVLHASVESFLPAADVARVDLRLNTHDELMCTADAFRLRQVFDNILMNAVKYTRADGSITVGATVAASTLRIDVADTGIGIEAEDLPRVFEPFYRSQIARDSGIIGSGIGLGVVREIVEDHGGLVTVTSAPAVGTTVSVHLPRLSSNQEK